MPNINIYLNWPLRISEPFMFSNISSWYCPLRRKINDLWKKMHLDEDMKNCLSQPPELHSMTSSNTSDKN